MSGVTYIPLLIFSLFLFLFTYLIIFLELNSRWGVKKLLLGEKASSSICSVLIFWFILLIHIPFFKYLNFFLYSFPFSIILSSLFILFLSHLIPPYSFIGHNSFLYSLFHGYDLKIIKCLVISIFRQFFAQFLDNCLTDWSLSYIISELSHFMSKIQD